jgi:Outer membrane protein beta-barrel domain
VKIQVEKCAAFFPGFDFERRSSTFGGFMKTASTVAAIVLSLTAGTVQAVGWFLGASAGLMDNNVSGYDNATNVGALLGYDVYTHDSIAVSLEGEITTTASNGDVSINGLDGEWNIDTQAAYVAARLGDRVYLKVRYGVLREDTSVKIDGVSQSDTDTGGSWGAALGWMLTPQWGIQLGGTLVESDINYWNLGVKYHFQ